MTITTVLALVALILAVISTVQSRGMSLLAWAVVLLALIYVLPGLR